MLKIPATEIRIRDYRPEDHNFILSTWLKSYRNSIFAKHIPNDPYFRHHDRLISNLLMRAKVDVVCDPLYENQVFGYVVRSPRRDIVHYIYIKYPFRKLGLAQHLIEHGGVKPEVVSHMPIH